AASAIATGVMSIVTPVAEAVNQYIVTPVSNMVSTAIEAILPGSPSEDVKEKSDEMAKALMEFLKAHAPKEGDSPPPLGKLLEGVATMIAGITGLYMYTSTASIALDTAHPIKNPGFKAAIMDILTSLGIPEFRVSMNPDIEVITMPRP
ncbi:unnamed protein product, partial [marine sediment metagenome]